MTPPGTDVAESDKQALELAEQRAREIAGAQADEYGSEPLQTALLKIGQGLTREVQDGNASAGEFVNSLTNEGIGTTIDFIIASYHHGRFAADDDGNGYVSFDTVIPEAWEPLVGAEYVGTPFAEHPEAEETYRERVRAKEIDWGSGPTISTTHNYTGLVVQEPADSDDEADREYLPSRLSLMRIQRPAHTKLQTLLRAVLRNKAPWDAVVQLSTSVKTFGRNDAYVIKPTDVRIVRQTTPQEKLAASEVGQKAFEGLIQVEGEAAGIADAPAEPDSNDGINVA